MKHCNIIFAAVAVATFAAYGYDDYLTTTSRTHERETLGGTTAYDHTDGSTTYTRQTLGGTTAYESTSGSWTHERETLGGTTAYDHSNNSTTYTRETLGGTTTYENTSGWNTPATTREATHQHGVTFDNSRTDTYGYDSRQQSYGNAYGRDTYQQTREVPTIQHRGSNENNPFGGGYSGDPFTIHGNILK